MFATKMPAIMHTSSASISTSMPRLTCAACMAYSASHAADRRDRDDGPADWDGGGHAFDDRPQKQPHEEPGDDCEHQPGDHAERRPHRRAPSPMSDLETISAIEKADTTTTSITTVAPRTSLVNGPTARDSEMTAIAREATGRSSPCPP